MTIESRLGAIFFDKHGCPPSRLSFKGTIIIYVVFRGSRVELMLEQSCFMRAAIYG
jgi:hypothetical protein